MQAIPFFETDYLRHDLRKGLVHNRSGTRQCFMPSEMIASMTSVLEEEVGPAWRGVMGDVGRLWGRRVARRYQRELSDFYGRPLHEMPMRELIRLVEGFFRYHGWGLLTLDFSESESGIIQATLENSAFVEIVGSSDGAVDHVVCGLLGEFFNQVAQRGDLECIETECTANGAPACRMILAIASRIDLIRADVRAGAEHEEVLRRLKYSTVAVVADVRLR